VGGYGWVGIFRNGTVSGLVCGFVWGWEFVCVCAGVFVRVCVCA